MASWGLSLFQIISTLIGSGLTIFLLNSITADLNQPSIKLDIVSNSIKNNITPIYASNNLTYVNNFTNKKDGATNFTNSNMFTKFDTIAINNGRTSATDLMLRIYYPNGNITGYYAGYQSENVTFNKQSPNLLIAETNRLAKDSIIDITTIVKCNLNFNNSGDSILNNDSITGNMPNQKCPSINYFVTSSYNQGSTFKTNIDANLINLDKFYSFHSRDQILTITMTFAIISFIAALIYKRIRLFKKRLSRPKFIFEIVKEIVTIREMIQNNMNSKRIFSIELWFSKDTEEKLKIFNDYSDYYHLDDFYLKLRERDECMSKKNHSNSKEITNLPVNIDTNKIDKKIIKNTVDFIKDTNDDSVDVRNLNEQCLTLANSAITNINWKNYQDVEDKKYYKPIAILVTIICAFLVSSSFESYRLTFFQSALDLPSLYYRLIYIFISTIVRALIFFMLAREIINFQTLFAYEVGSTNNILSFFILDKKAQIKLLLFSLIIGGLPILPILTDFHLISDEIRLFSTDPALGYLLFITGLMIDIGLFLVLVLVIPRFVMKTKIVKI